MDLNYLEAIKFATFITNANSKLQNFGNTGKNAPSGDFNVLTNDVTERRTLLGSRAAKYGSKIWGNRLIDGSGHVRGVERPPGVDFSGGGPRGYTWF